MRPKSKKSCASALLQAPAASKAAIATLFSISSTSVLPGLSFPLAFLVATRGQRVVEAPADRGGDLGVGDRGALLQVLHGDHEVFDRLGLRRAWRHLRRWPPLGCSAQQHESHDR